MNLNVPRFITLTFCAAFTLVLIGCDGYEARREAYHDKAQTLFDAGDMERARLELKNALQIDNKHAPSWFLMGRLEEAERELRKAYANYSQAIEIDSGHSDARIRRSLLLLGANQLDQAEEDITAVLSANPQHADGLAARAALKRKRGDLEGGEQDAREALAQDERNLSAALFLASAQIKRKEFGEAEQTLKKAIELNPDSAAARLVLGSIYNATGNTDGALGVLKGLAEQNPDQFAYKVRLANFFAQRDRLDEAEKVLRDALAETPDDFDKQRALLVFLASKKGNDAAASELSKMLARSPEDADLRFVEASFALQAKNADEAKRIYRQVIETAKGIGPNAVKARNALAEMLLKEGELEEASALIEETLKEEARDADALFLHAVIALKNKDLDQAVADLRAVLRERPDRIAAWRMLGQSHIARNELELAEEAFEKALAIEPDDLFSQSRMAALKLHQGDAEAAKTALEAIADKTPENIGVQQALARIHFAQKDWSALAEGGERLKERAPDQPLGPYLEGLALQKQGRQEEAIAAFEQALELKPNAIEPLAALVQSHMALNEPAKAEARITNLLDKSPGNPVFVQLLGNLYLASGEKDKALTLHKEAIALNPKAPQLHLRYAQLLAAEGDLETAYQILVNGAKETEGNPNLLVESAILAQRMGDYRAAVDAYEKVLGKHPDSLLIVNNLAMLLATHIPGPDSLDRAFELAERLKESEQPLYVDTLGWIHHLRGEFEQASVYLEKANDLKQGIAEIEYHLGMNYLKLGEQDKARKYLAAAAAAERFPDQDKAEAALKTLSEQG